MDVGRVDAVLEQEGGEFFGHALGEGGDQRALVALQAEADFLHQVVNGIVRVAHLYLGVQQPRGADHLFDHDTFALVEFVVGWRSTDINGLGRHLAKLIKGQRAVVQGSGQAEAVVHKSRLARAVAAVHRANLGNAHVALVDDHQEILGEEVQQTVGTRAWLAAIKIARVVLNAAAMAQFANHLNVVGDALVEAFGF